ncbi:MAG: hypothetical protein R3234_08840 [Thermoanaerobaculia bacterium]|nr:hypothetical protein [Thermoanaerobaculia bacterium]
MSEDLQRESEYLWDPGAEPDPEIAALEEELAPLRHRGDPPDLPGNRGEEEPASRSGISLRRPLVAVLAAVLVAALGVGLWLRLAPSTGTSRAGSGITGQTGEVAVLAGSARIDGRDLEADGKLAPGRRLTPDPEGRARLSLPSVGEVDVDAGSELTLTESGAEIQRFHLDRGKLEAWIWAPPGVFEVDTPAARAIDLGCVYELVVDDEGAGHLAVTSGWVALVDAGRESFVPAGARTSIDPDRGPGIPLWNDAPEELRNAVAVLEEWTEASPRRRRALRAALRAARVDDALTLWHLLSRVSREERGLVAERLAELAPPPETVDRQAVLAGEQEALDAWWEALDLGSASWWRHWRQPL